MFNSLFQQWATKNLPGFRRRSRLDCRPRLELLEDRTLPSVFVVINNSDFDHFGTLRWAINQANADPDPSSDIIFSSIGTIAVGSSSDFPGVSLPTITHPVNIDGTTNFRGGQVVLEGGAAPGFGLDVEAPNCTIKGLLVFDFTKSGIFVSGAAATNNRIDSCHLEFNSTGVAIEDGASGNVIVNSIISNNQSVGVALSGPGTDNNQVASSAIGCDFAGTTAMPNGSGVEIGGSASNNTIGGTAGDRNVISGNTQDGVLIYGDGTSGNLVANNQIGTDANGTSTLPNQGSGVLIDFGTNNTISDNVISGNTGSGVRITDPGTTGNTVRDNFIGTSADGLMSLANQNGVAIDTKAGSNTIGPNNVISGNRAGGVRIVGKGTTGNRVIGNRIGTDRTGNAALDNGEQQIDGSGTGDGVYIESSDNNTIGGTGFEDGNLISGNLDNGISILGAEAVGNDIYGNFIGTTFAGGGALGNHADGVLIRAGHDVVGGDFDNGGNVISGNAGDGVHITGTDAMEDTVQGNRIGTRGDGMLAVGNFDGIVIDGGAKFSLIGNNIGRPSNLISGNQRDGVLISGLGTVHNQVSSNEIGTNADLSAALGNGASGVHLEQGAGRNDIGDPFSNFGGISNGGNVIEGNDIGIAIDSGATDNIIGGTAFGAGNHITENTIGIFISGFLTGGTLVEGNMIGTDFFGLDADPNDEGIVLESHASDNTIGGAAPGAGNLISGNLDVGIVIRDGDTIHNSVLGNRIGISTAGAGTPLGNRIGVVIEAGANDNSIGGTAAGEGNFISGNREDGIDIQGDQTARNQIQGNEIGTGTDGAKPVPNQGNGVRIASGARENHVGDGAGNTIAYNLGNGVSLLGDGSVQNPIRTNSIFNNGALGIDLGGDGVTPNTPGGPHTGPNHLQNYPTLAFVSPGTVNFTLNSIASDDHALDFFANTSIDPSGHGEGEIYLGSAHGLTDGAGDFVGTFTYTPIPGKPFITATATEGDGNTSEFSGAAFPIQITPLHKNLRINLDPRAALRLLIDPLSPRFLDLAFATLTTSIDPTAIDQIVIQASEGNSIFVDPSISSLPAGLSLVVQTAGDASLHLPADSGGIARLEIDGPETLTVDGSLVPSTQLVLNSGTLRLGTGTDLGSGPFTVNGGAIEAAGGPVVINNPITLSGDVTLGGNQPITLNGHVTLSANPTLTVANTSNINAPIDDIEQEFGLTKRGAGTLLLSRRNSYSGDTTLDEGTLVVGDDLALGTGPLLLGGGTIQANGAAHALGNPITLAGDVTVGGTWPLTFNGPVILTGDRILTVQPGAAVVLKNLSQDDTDRSLTKAGPGLLLLNTANHYSAGTHLEGGVLEVDDDMALGAGPLLLHGGTLLTQAPDTTLSNPLLLDGDIAFGATSAGKAILFSGPATLTGSCTLTVNTQVTFGGPIDQTRGALTKLGTAPLFFEGKNSYSGLTTVSAGPVVVDGTQLDSAVLVGWLGTLRGTGTVGPLDVSGGTVSPGDSPGILTVSGKAVFTLGSTFAVLLDGTTAGSGYSQLDASGSVDLAGSTLAIRLDKLVSAGTMFTIVHGDSGLSGVFAGHPNGSTFVAGNSKFRIDYTDNDVILTSLEVHVPTMLTVNTSPNPAIAGNDVFTVTVQPTLTPPPGIGLPTGNVTFRVISPSGAEQKQRVLASGARFNALLRTGANTIVVSYSGDQNFAGSSTTMTLTVQGIMTMDPVDQSVDAGQTATFKAAFSDPAATVQWQSSKDGGHTYSNISGATRGTLVLRNVSASASGLLVRAAFSTSSGTLYSGTAQLQVNPLLTLGNLTVTRGISGTLFEGNMPITGGTAPFTITAFSGLPPGSTQPQITRTPPTYGFFVTFRFTPTTSGTYHGSVTLRDHAGASVSRTLTITIASHGAQVAALVALTKDGHLLTFDPRAPDKITSNVTVTGLAQGDVLRMLVYSPQGKLYGIAGPGFFDVTLDRLYTVNPATGVATPGASLLQDNLFSVETLAASFDPLTSQLRVIDDTGHNELIDPVMGANTQAEAPAFVQGDVNHDTGCFLTAMAYDNQTSGAASSTLYGVANVPALVTIGGPGGNPSADTGEVHTVAATQAFYGFTITGTNNTAYALGEDSSQNDTALWTVNLSSGLVTRSGHFGSTLTIISLAASPG
jgi:autotransporter-associated beta strand protein